MSSLKNLFVRLGDQYRRADVADIIRAIGTHVDGLVDGSIAYRDNAVSVAPTSSVVPPAAGDLLWKLNPTVQGTVGAQYVTYAFMCVADGTPGTWVELRGLTGT